MSFHSTQTLANVHTPISFEYVDAATREADTTLAASDLYKFARQTDDDSVYMLTSTTPTWQQIGLGNSDNIDSIYNANGSVPEPRTVTLEDTITFTPDTDGDHTVAFGPDISNRIDEFDVYTDNILDLSCGDSGDRSFVTMFGPAIGGMQLGYFSGETSLMGFNINFVGDGDFEVIDQVNLTGMVYATDYSANFVDRSIVDKAYVDGTSIYTSNGTITDAARTVTTADGGGLTLLSYDVNGSSAYSERSRLLVNDQNITMIHNEGTGDGSDAGTKSIQLNPSQMLVTDTTDEEGLEYAANYSANWGNRHLVDKQYADGAGIGYNSLTLTAAGSRFLLGENGTDLTFGVFDTDVADYNDYVELDIDPTEIALTHITGDGAGGITSQRDFAVNSSGFSFTGGDINFTTGDIIADFGRHMAWKVTSFPDDLWEIDASGGQQRLNFSYNDNGTPSNKVQFGEDGSVRATGDFYNNGTLIVPTFASQLAGASTNVTVTTTEQTIVLDSTTIDGSGSEYTINLANNRIDLDTADGVKVYEVNYMARFNLEGGATTGAARSYGRVKGQLDGVDVTGSEQWTYIREYQGGTNGIPNTGLAGSFLMQPAADDEFTFVVYGTTEGGEPLSDFELESLVFTIKRVA